MKPKTFGGSLSYWHLLLGGLFLFATSNCFHNFIFINNKLFRVAGLLGAACVWTAYFHLPKARPFRGRWQALCVFFLCVNVVTVLRGIYYSTMPYQGFFTHSSFMWAFVVPFFLCLRPTPAFVRALVKWCRVYVWFALFFCLYNFSDFFVNPVEVMRGMVGWDAYHVDRPQVPCEFVLPACAFLFYWREFPARWKALMAVTVTLALGAASMSGRRSSTASVLVFVLVAACYLYYRSGNKTGVILAVSLLAVVVSRNLDMKFWEGKYEFLLSRIDADTRSGVEEDFYRDMSSVSDWVVGRGMSGTYANSILSIGGRRRILIETGYLNLILHGGLCLLVPYVLLMLRAVYKGLFSSRNLLCKTCAVYVLVQILSLYPGGTPGLQLRYVMTYLFIAMCNSPEWLDRTDEDISRMRLFSRQRTAWRQCPR